ncbi:MAG: putative manganese-dependent inorganic diphosphatase [Erysipelotrichaceae bacterium]|nr:putative manganese-dependent inorganic diphosphatase [Erysipelotrichaceae bacterium]
MKRPVYITGHKNPDTDSIVSSIAYAEYKRLKGVNAIAGRLGSVSSETEWLLEKFQYDEPVRLLTARSVLRDIEMDEAITITEDATMHDAVKALLGLKHRGVIVVDENKHMLGMITFDDLTSLWVSTERELENILKKANVESIAKVLRGKIVHKAENFKSNGQVLIDPIESEEIEKGSIVIVNNKSDIVLHAIDAGASLIINLNEDFIRDSLVLLAKENGVSLIRSKYSPLRVSRLLYETPPAKEIMVPANKVIAVHTTDTVEEVMQKLSKSRYRSYPVLDENEVVVGSVSRYHLLNYTKKALILVDHNEKKQSIDDIDSGEVLEIVDHHRFGGFESTNPINITTMAVGATATIIAKMYMDENIELDQSMAGLLLGAIVADTMNFNSPTTTQIDIDIAHKLEEIAKISHDEIAEGLVSANASLLDKKVREIVFDDFKDFETDGIKYGLSQAICKSEDEFIQIKDEILEFLSDACKSNHYSLMIVMFTRPNGSGSYILYAGEKSYKVKEALGEEGINGGFVSGLVSRKKQLLPKLIKALGE